MANVPNSLDQERVFDTKLRPPLIRNKIIERSDLHKELEEGINERSLISIVAPAGSGKSTLMAKIFEEFESSNIKCYWLSLDPEDDEPVVFAKYLISSIYHLDPSTADKELAFLRANPARNFDAFYDSLIGRITSYGEQVSLFIDDFQYLTHPIILRFWNRLISHAPTSFRLIIASRTKLQLELSRRRLAGTLLELDQSDLNFDLEQIIDFMQELHSITLPASDAHLLYTSTEGWVAGLQLAGLAISKQSENSSEMIQTFSGRDKDLTEYLFQTVLNVQDDEIRDFLLCTSPLSRMSPGLCNAVTGGDDALEKLDIIETHNLFIIPLDREGKWFRYHHLFSEFLQNELRKSDPDGFSGICEKAAHWCERQGRITESIQYCLSGKFYDKAADLIAEHSAEAALNNGDHYSILDWMRRLPDDYHYKRPEIILNHAWSRAFSRDLDKAHSLVDEVLTGLDEDKGYNWKITDEERKSFKSLGLVTKSIATVCADELIHSLQPCIELFEKLPDTLPFHQAAILNAISYCYFARGESSKAVRAGSDAYQYGKIAGSEYATVWADFLTGMANLALGKVRAAEENATRAINNVGPRTQSNSYMYAMAALTKAEVATQRCDFEEVERRLSVGKEFSSVFGPLEPLLVALRTEARLKAWKGELGEARKILHQGQDTALGTEQPRLYFALAAEEIDFQLRYDDLSSAEDTLKRTNLLNLDQPIITPDIKSAVQEFGKITEIKLLIAKEEHEKALRHINALSKNTFPDQRAQLCLALKGLKAIALWKSGKEREARRELDRALATAATEDHAYPLISAGNTLVEILESIQHKRIDGYVGNDHELKHKFERKLISLIRGERPETPVHSQSLDDGRQLIEPLTERELEILKLLGAGLGNKQLADEMLISIATVKWHLHNIYEKIGVRSRTAAAAHARKLSLI